MIRIMSRIMMGPMKITMTKQVTMRRKTRRIS
jgi:hypothetical protein